MTALDPARIGSILISMNSHFQQADFIQVFEDVIGGRGTTNPPIREIYLDPVTGFDPVTLTDLGIVINKYLAAPAPGLPTFYYVNGKFYGETPYHTDLAADPPVYEPSPWMLDNNPFLLRRLEQEQLEQQAPDPPEFYVADTASNRNIVQIRETSATYDDATDAWTTPEIGAARAPQKLFWLQAQAPQDIQPGIALSSTGQEVEFSFTGELEMALTLTGSAPTTYCTAPTAPTDGVNAGVEQEGSVGANFLADVIYELNGVRTTVASTYIEAAAASNREFQTGFQRLFNVQSGSKIYVELRAFGDSTATEPLACTLNINYQTFCYFINHSMPVVVDEPDIKGWENILPTQALGTSELTRYELNKALAGLTEIKFEVAYGFGSHTAQLRIMTESIPIHNIAFVDDAVQGVPGSSSYRYTVVLDSNTGCQTLQARRILGSATTTNFLRFLLYKDADNITDIGVFGATIRLPGMQTISISKVYVR